MLQKFADMKVGTRILVGYIIALILMAIVGGVSIWRINDIGNTVDVLVNDLAVDRQFANQISERILEVRLSYPPEHGTTQTAAGQVGPIKRDVPQIDPVQLATAKVHATAPRGPTRPERCDAPWISKARTASI